MTNKIKITLVFFSAFLVISIITLVLSAWIISTNGEISSEEITVLYDPSLEKYDLQNSFDYEKENKYPHMNLGVDPETNESLFDEFIDKYDVTYLKRESDGQYKTAKNIMDAGTYIARYYNKEKRIYSDFTYKINPVSPILTCSYTTTSAKQYTPTLGPVDSNFTCTGLYGDGILSGQLSYDKSFPVESTTDINGLKMIVTCVFKPNNTNYTSAKIDVEVPLIAVARIGSRYYSRIENALNAAISGNEVRIVIGTNPYIYEDCTIKTGVKLHINFADESVNSSTGTHSGASAGKYEITNKVTVSPDIKITIQDGGTLEVGGELSGGGADAKCGATTGKSSVLTLSANSGIISFGTIDCYGFIKEDTKNNRSYINAESGKIYLPFIIRDFRGGTRTQTIYNDFDSIHCPPFNQMQFENIEPLLTVKYNTELYGYANLYAGSQQNQTTICFISSTSNSLIQFTSENYSYLTAKYDNITECITLNIFGGARTNAMSMKLSLSLGFITIPLDVSTEDVFFSLTFRQNISLNVNKNAGQNIANYEINQRYKLMPGAILTINEGAILNATNITVYRESDYTVTASIGSKPYPSGKGDARLIVNGELHISTIAGFIESEKENSFLFITTDVKELIQEPYSEGSSGSSIQYTNLTKLSTLLEYQNDGAPIENNAQTGVYESKKCIYDNTTYYYWDKYSDEELNTFTIKYVTNSETSTLSDRKIYTLDDVLILNELVLPDESSVSKNGYTLENWYIDSLFQTEAMNYPLTNSEITLYANWTLDTYSIFYSATIDNPEGEETIDISSQITGFPTSYTVNDSNPILNDLVVDGYEFIGWYYYNNNEFISIDQFDVSLAKNTTFIARFIKEEKPYQIKYQLVYNGELVGETVIVISDLKLPDLSSLKINSMSVIDTLKTDYGNSVATNPKYFVGHSSTDNAGWYMEKGCITTLSSVLSNSESIKQYVDNDTGDYQVVIIYGQLKDKVTITYEGIANSYYYIPGSTIATQNPNDHDANNYMYFWENSTRTVISSYGGNILVPESSLELIKVKYIKTTLTTSNSTLQVKTSDKSIFVNNDFTSSTSSSPCYIRFNSSVTVSVTYTADNDRTCTVKTGSTTVLDNSGGGSYTVNSESSYTISSSSSCITADTLITLANGTKKQVQDLSADDLLLVFNHETGKYEFANIIFIDIEPERIYRIVNLKFSDGTIVKVVYEHGFFDLDLNKYVYIREDNMHEFIGHKFYQADFDGINYVESEVTLVDAYVTEELTTVYSPVTVYHLNYFTEDMLSMPAGIPGLFNIFEFGDNLTYDEEQMQADIEKYGLYTYDDFKDYISYEVYMMFPAPYLKVAVGKGLTTYEDIVQMIYTYLEKHDLMKNNNS